MRYPLDHLYSKILGISIVLATTSCANQSADSALEVIEKTEFKNYIVSHSTKAITTDTANVKSVDVEGMVLFLDGKIRFGSYAGKEVERPMFEKKINSFLLDANPISVAQFRKFIISSGYKTDAELAGQSLVYLPYLGDWQAVKGANWEFPLGKRNNKAEDNHPVTHISYNDAIRYAQWCGKRLPTEFEFEYAARAGRNTSSRFFWGDEPAVLGRFKGNFSQAESAVDSTSRDFNIHTSPIGYYGASESTLNDIVGNVWEWTSSLLEPYPGSISESRAGPSRRVLRGGSFMVNPIKDKEFGIWTRFDADLTTSRFDFGFRCAASIEK